MHHKINQNIYEAVRYGTVGESKKIFSSKWKLSLSYISLLDILLNNKVTCMNNLTNNACLQLGVVQKYESTNFYVAKQSLMRDVSEYVETEKN